ncbi:MAG: hypothetical protein SGI92_20925 [Bryobacteraceae bacterium]|nr:hypothetical protein [Bryobacteraceae bacterium]
MTSRRAILLAAVALAPVPLAALLADGRTDALDMVAPLAAALSSDERDGAGWNPPRDLPNAAELRTNIDAMMAQAVVASSIDVLSVESGKAELDWFMQIRSRSSATLVEQRRGTIKIAWTKKRLTQLEPASLFAPPKVG